MKYEIPRIMVAAANRGSGTTLVTSGILNILKQKYVVKAFKCGPDYIDPMFHEKILDVPSKNLDTYFTGEDLTRQLLAEEAKAADIAVIEGNGGYYDGLSGISTEASAYDLARVTKTPVLLVVDGQASGISLAAGIRGFMTYRRPCFIKGIIFNNISGEMYPRLKTLVEKELPVRVCGYLPTLADVEFESRHLELAEPEELAEIQEKVERITKQCEETIDFNAILEIAEKAPVVECKSSMHYVLFSLARIRIAVAKDEAFMFYYKDNLKLLELLGAELVYFSPMKGDRLPENIQGLLIGGGYPELYARELSENIYMKAAIYDALEEGLPCIAAGEGMLYLQEMLTTPSGESFSMVGYLTGEARYTGTLQSLGRVELQGNKHELFEGKGMKMRGYELHHMASTEKGDAFLVKKPVSEKIWESGHATPTLCAGFPQLYLYSNIDAAKKFMKQCKKYKKKMQKNK